MDLVVGGEYLVNSVIESSALIHLGLLRMHTVVDVGCGTGRLPYGLRSYLAGRYYGIDILDEALVFARTKCCRPDWQFISNKRSTIPVPSGVADFVTFFSLFTHLLDEEVFKFLREAKRVVKPDGKIVLSFLDYDCEAHWSIFLETVENENPHRVLNRFMMKSMIQRWAWRLGLNVETIYEGTQKWVPLREEVRRDNGNVLRGTIEFGQSVAVLGIFPEAEYITRHPDVGNAVTAGTFMSGAQHYAICGFREGREL